MYTSWEKNKTFTIMKNFKSKNVQMHLAKKCVKKNKHFLIDFSFTSEKPFDVQKLFSQIKKITSTGAF